jgi:hypothetical protein
MVGLFRAVKFGAAVLVAAVALTGAPSQSYAENGTTARYD